MSSSDVRHKRYGVLSAYRSVTEVIVVSVQTVVVGGEYRERHLDAAFDKTTSVDRPSDGSAICKPDFTLLQTASPLLYPRMRCNLVCPQRAVGVEQGACRSFQPSRLFLRLRSDWRLRRSTLKHRRRACQTLQYHVLSLNTRAVRYQLAVHLLSVN